MGRQQWCEHGWAARDCCRHHIRDRIPVGPGRGQKRRCPICGGDLSINPGDGRQWIIWNCVTSSCEPEIIRAALEDEYRIHPLCLGNYCSDEYMAAKRDGRQPRTYNAPPDPVTLSTERKWWAAQKLIGCNINGSLHRMCLQAISEGDGSIPGDPELLLPRDRDAFAALAKRTGLERRHAYILADRWLKDGA